MTREAQQETHNNPAVQLHDILAALRTESNDDNRRQRDALCKVLRVPRPDIALLHTRLAELYKLPRHVRRLLVGMGAHPQFLEWAAPIENAILELDGSTHTNLVSFRETAGLSKALHNLPLCGALLEGRDSLEVEQLSEIRAAIESAQATLYEADDIDSDLAEWLQYILQEAESAVADALAVGVYAARGKLRAIIGGARLDPHPPAATEKEREVLKSVADVVIKLATMVNAGSNVARLLTE